MPLGPGKYDDLCEYVRNKAGVIGMPAQGALVIVVGGTKGSGFSMKSDALLIQMLPGILRNVADQIEKGAAN